MSTQSATRSTYEETARRIAAAMGLTVKAEKKGDRCPPWEKPCKCIHGDRYRVTLKLRCKSSPHGDSSLSFDFWNSLHDKQNGRDLGYYDILSCVGADATGPTDPDEVVAEYGNMKPSQAIAVTKFSARLQAFFSAKEIEALSKIR